jgi:hypothetical protein
LQGCFSNPLNFGTFRAPGVFIQVALVGEIGNLSQHSLKRLDPLGLLIVCFTQIHLCNAYSKGLAQALNLRSLCAQLVQSLGGGASVGKVNPRLRPVRNPLQALLQAARVVGGITHPTFQANGFRLRHLDRL